jgi:hypothetical protein
MAVITLNLATPGMQLGYGEPETFSSADVLVYDNPVTSAVWRIGAQDIQGDDWQTDWLTGGYGDLGDADSRAVTLYENTPQGGYTEQYSDSTVATGNWSPRYDLSGETPGRWWRIRTVWTWTGSGTWGVDRYLYLVGDGEGANGSGQVVSLFSYERPEVQHIVYQTLNGDLVARQNPS